MFKQIFLSSAVITLLLFPLCYKPLPASAMTGEEFVKLLGVLSRYGEDLQKTFPGTTAPTSTPEPDSTPTVPEPSPDEENPN